jgi:CheY-like chemotaxis protein
VVFSTIGRDRIKCLSPHFLFALPILELHSCTTAASIEERIRSAWHEHIHELRKTQEWLSHIGVDSLEVERDSVLCFSLEDVDASARVRMRDAKHVILPGVGPLSGIALETPELRVLTANENIDSGIDLEAGISTRMEELARIADERPETRRSQPLVHAPSTPAPVLGRRTHRVLLVGQRLADESQFIESMRLRGYRVHRAASEHEALACFDDVSPELVLADADLGRSEGTDLILALRELHGIEDIPVLLVDENHPPKQRAADAEGGAARYLSYPIDASRIASDLAQILDQSTRRRFTRYAHPVSVELQGVRRPYLTSSLGRGGMFVSIEEEIPEWGLYTCELALPGLDLPLSVDADICHRGLSPHGEQRGIGMRFLSFPKQHEAALIDFLHTLESLGAQDED